jgi:hypothetical protein
LCVETSIKEVPMADTVRVVEYFYLTAPHKAGAGSDVLNALKAAGVNLIGFSGFPEGRRAQLDFLPEDPAAFKALARRQGWKPTGPKKAFLVQGEDRVGIMADLASALAEAGINIVAADALCAGAGRYGVVLWVAQRDVKRAAKVLGAT